MSENSNGIGSLGGAVVGAGILGGASTLIKPMRWTAKPYNDTAKLVQLDKDTFEAKVAANKEKLGDDGKAAFGTLEKAREEYAKGSEELETFLNKNAGSVGNEANYVMEGQDKTIKQLQEDLLDKGAKVNVADDEAVKAAQKALDELPKKGQKGYKAAAVKDAEAKLEAAKTAALNNNEEVKAAREVLNKARAERFGKIEKAITEGSDEALKKGLAEAKDVMKKLNEGILKDFDLKSIKKALPKSKWAIAIYAGIGALLGALAFGGNKSAEV